MASASQVEYMRLVSEAIQQLRDAGNNRAAVLAAWERLGELWEENARDAELPDELVDALNEADPHFQSIDGLGDLPMNPNGWKRGRDIVLKAADKLKLGKASSSSSGSSSSSSNAGTDKEEDPGPVEGGRKSRKSKKSRKTKKTRKTKRRMTRRA